MGITTWQPKCRRKSVETFTSFVRTTRAHQPYDCSRAEDSVQLMLCAAVLLALLCASPPGATLLAPLLSFAIFPAHGSHALSSRKKPGGRRVTLGCQ